MKAKLGMVILPDNYAQKNDLPAEVSWGNPFRQS